MQKKSPNAEWPYPVNVDSIPDMGRHVKMVATAEQCAAIAERLELLGVQKLEADLELNLQNGGHILYVQGALRADVTQSCVVSGQPIESHVEDNFEAWFANNDKVASFSRARHEAQLKSESEEVQMLEEKDDPEPLVDGQVDLGDLVIQYLSLAINPYPRHPSAGDAPVAEADPKKAAAGNLRPNPFAALKNWRPKD